MYEYICNMIVYDRQRMYIYVYISMHMYVEDLYEQLQFGLGVGTCLIDDTLQLHIQNDPEAFKQ